MRVDVYLPLITSLLLGLAAPRLARWLPPATAARALLVAGLTAAMSTVYALVLLAWTLAAEIPLVAWLGGWSFLAWARLDPVAPPVAALAVAALMVCGVRLAAAVRRYRLSRADVALLGRELAGSPAGPLVVVPSDSPEAFALPYGRGLVVVSTGMFAALSPAERGALLAHEQAHLAHAHHVYRTLAGFAAAVNPLLVSLPGAVRFATERWADEDAAAITADRALAARALARAALATLASPPRAGLGYHSCDVSDRVSSLLRPTPRHRPLLVATLATLITITLWAPVDANADSDTLLAHACTTSCDG
ncbi:M56 family metallopeptidase [Nonomuraea sediminis]|uniref:M56 family metallopeptidase n=1 Tax=Nonomuraea sediminis TaxID=2835864 RepID=UPI001BDC01E2|nr:M56 family metallopeptidase [Nonomuraea sediminis]